MLVATVLSGHVWGFPVSDLVERGAGCVPDRGSEAAMSLVCRNRGLNVWGVAVDGK